MGKRMIKRETVDLPEEIVEEILHCQLIKSLLRSRCVSKRWCSTISNEGLIKHNMKKNSNTKVICLSYPYDTHRSCSLRPLLDGNNNNNPVTITSLDRHPVGHFISSCSDPSEEEYSMIHNLSVLSVNILGSCNGLVLATVNWKYLIIWNPLTREAKNIICFVGGIVREPGYFVYGFGCDEHTNDYKIVYFFFSVSTCHAEMYSSRTNSWKKIENYHKVFEYGYSGKFVNGRLHWMAVSRGCYTSWEIGSLDLVEENFGTLARPDYFLKYSSRPNLENLGGYLSLICFDDGNNIHIWGMTKYDEAESWTKFWTLFNWIEDFKYYATTTPFWVTKNGDTAVAFGPYIIVFDKKDESRQSRFRVDRMRLDLDAILKCPRFKLGLTYSLKA